MMTIKIVEKTVPEQVATPVGTQRELLLMIMGATPTTAVAEVEKTGNMRRRPAPKVVSLGL